MSSKTGLVRQSLAAAAISAYAGSVLMFALDMTRRIYVGADARMCPIGSRELTDLCTIGELALGYAFTLIWAIFAFPFAMVFCAPIALLLGQLAPTFDTRFSPQNVRYLQFSLAAAVGFAVMFLFSILWNDGDARVLGFVGLITALVAVWVFRRMRYHPTKAKVGPGIAIE